MPKLPFLSLKSNDTGGFGARGKGAIELLAGQPGLGDLGVEASRGGKGSGGAGVLGAFSSPS